MKSRKRLPISAKRTWILIVLTLVLLAGIRAIIYFTTKDEPSWKYVQSFHNNMLLTSVEKSSKQYKYTRDDFFLIHCYDVNSKNYLEVINIPIKDGMDTQAEYMGYSDRYIWLRTPEWVAVDMHSPNKTVLDFSTIAKRICKNNPSQFSQVISLSKVEDYLKATNQNGDQFFVNLTTFQTTQSAPIPYYDAYHVDYSLLDQLPENVSVTTRSYTDYYAVLDSTEYSLKPASENNLIQRTFFKQRASGDAVIQFTATDTTQVLVKNGNQVITIDQANTNDNTIQETRMSNLIFINAIGIGIHGDAFVFRYQKSTLKAAPWYLAWFDLKSNKVIKELNLETMGLKLGETNEALSHRVSIDEKWVFLMISEKQPVRIKL